MARIEFPLRHGCFSSVHLEYREGRIEVPDAPGLGIRLDREKMVEHADLYRELGGYPYDRDPGHPGGYALVPKQRFADPSASLKPTLDT